MDNVPEGVHIDFLRAERSLHRWAHEDVQRIHSAELIASTEGAGVQMHVLEDAGHWVCFCLLFSSSFSDVNFQRTKGLNVQPYSNKCEFQTLPYTFKSYVNLMSRRYNEYSYSQVTLIIRILTMYLYSRAYILCILTQILNNVNISNCFEKCTRMS